MVEAEDLGQREFVAILTWGVVLGTNYRNVHATKVREGGDPMGQRNVPRCPGSRGTGLKKAWRKGTEESETEKMCGYVPKRKVAVKDGRWKAPSRQQPLVVEGVRETFVFVERANNRWIHVYLKLASAVLGWAYPAVDVVLKNGGSIRIERHHCGPKSFQHNFWLTGRISVFPPK